MNKLPRIDKMKAEMINCRSCVYFVSSPIKTCKGNYITNKIVINKAASYIPQSKNSEVTIGEDIIRTSCIILGTNKDIKDNIAGSRE
jgi:hypothetical protein|mmetsp:Transcript_21049/g.3403  ORF Transcript_21049/g.3403 Transcript_21049/m.3403 type:complete len:87 (-) Transcript_21049:1322-1582(-)